MQKRLTLKHLMLVLILVLALTASTAVALSACNTQPASIADAAEGFTALSNGSQYSFTKTDYSEEIVTVESDQPHGSEKNPYVISDKDQWNAFVLFVNSNDTSGKVFVLGSDIDFEGDPVTPAGNDAHPFAGRLYGQKHLFKNAVYGNASIALSKYKYTHNVTALFGVVSNATIADFAIKDCTISANTQTATMVAGLAGEAANSNFVNVSIKNNISVSNSDGAAPWNLYVLASGFVGAATNDLNFYKCTYEGTIDYNITYGTDVTAQGILIGTSTVDPKNFVADNCYIDAVVNAISGNIQCGIFGHHLWGPDAGNGSRFAGTSTFKNGYAKMLLIGVRQNVSSPNGALLGYSNNASLYVENAYFVSNMPIHAYSSITCKNVYFTQSANSIVSTGVTNSIDGATIYADNDQNRQTVEDMFKKAVESGSIPGMEIDPETDEPVIKGEAGKYYTYNITYNLGVDDSQLELVDWKWKSGATSKFEEDITGMGVVISPLADKF